MNIFIFSTKDWRNSECVVKVLSKSGPVAIMAKLQHNFKLLAKLFYKILPTI